MPDTMTLTVASRGGSRFDMLRMSPVALFVGSLAGCVGYFVARSCARHNIPCEGFAIVVEWSMAECTCTVRPGPGPATGHPTYPPLINLRGGRGGVGRSGVRVVRSSASRLVSATGRGSVWTPAWHTPGHSP
jgi:hypothetical protein